MDSLNRNRESGLDRVYKMAKKSTMIHKHGAVIIRNNEIIGEGYNHVSSYMSHRYSVHAEVAAIMSVPKRLRNRRTFEESTMLVVRICGKDHHLNMSKPCENCRKEIEKAGIRRVFYSVDTNNTNSDSLSSQDSNSAYASSSDTM